MSGKVSDLCTKVFSITGLKEPFSAINYRITTKTIYNNRSRKNIAAENTWKSILEYRE